MQKAEWICSIKLTFFCVCLAAPMGFHLYLVFKQEAEGAAPPLHECLQLALTVQGTVSL